MTMTNGEQPYFDPVEHDVSDEALSRGAEQSPEQAPLLAVQAIGEVLREAPEEQALSPHATAYLSQVIEGNLSFLKMSDAPVIIEVLTLVGASQQQYKESRLGAILEGLISLGKARTEIATDLGITQTSIATALGKLKGRILKSYGAKISLNELDLQRPSQSKTPLTAERPSRMTRVQAQAAIRILGSSRRLEQRHEVDPFYMGGITKQLLDEVFKKNGEDLVTKEVLTGYLLRGKKSSSLHTLGVFRDAMRELEERTRELRKLLPDVKSADDFAAHLHERYQKALEKSLKKARKSV